MDFPLNFVEQIFDAIAYFWKELLFTIIGISYAYKLNGKFTNKLIRPVYL